MTTLSPRQREILALVAAGRTSKEIASALGISESTVNWHLSNAFARLGASSRAEAVAIAMRDDIDRDDIERAADPQPIAHLLPSTIWLALAATLVLGIVGGALIAAASFTGAP
jgi:DNA-binding CsgD family transcriptional regulator